MWLLLPLILSVVVILAIPRKRNEDQVQIQIETEDSPEVSSDEIRPSNSFYDHLMGNLQNSNQFVNLAMLPQGIPPPVDNDYDGAPIPQAHYAFVNPALNGENVPHWTETLQNLKNNLQIPTDVKDQVFNSLSGPIKIYGDGTESKFPLLIEYFVQRIQNYFSTYVHEDMSRPASWEVKVNASDGKPSSEREPITEDGKVELDSNADIIGSSGANVDEEAPDDIDYIVDITLRPDIDDTPEVELTDEDFEKTTEEWENVKGGEKKAPEKEKEDSGQKVIVKETVDLKVIDPIAIEVDSFLYVGDGNGDELLTRSNKRRKLKKKKRN